MSANQILSLTEARFSNRTTGAHVISTIAILLKKINLCHHIYSNDLKETFSCSHCQHADQAKEL